MAAKRARGGGRPTVRRRSFLVAGALVAAGAAIGALTRVLGRWGTGTPSAPVAPTAPESRVFPPAAFPLLLTVADAIIPRFGSHPAASEIDLIPRLDRVIERSPDGPGFYRDGWRPFERALRARVPTRNGQTDVTGLTSLLLEWHREYAAEDAPDHAPRYFEGLRRSVLLAYYTAPEGWASVSYPGPVRRSHPGEGGSGG